MKVSIINGPNLNLLEKGGQYYGENSCRKSMTILRPSKQVWCKLIFSLKSRRGNNRQIQEASAVSDGIVINAGALSHYSYAIRDILLPREYHR